jgi:hypothetical protein
MRKVMLSHQPKSPPAPKNKREIAGVFWEIAIFGVVGEAITLVANLYSLNWWTKVGLLIGVGVVVGVLAAIRWRRRLRALPNWLPGEARVEVVTPLRGGQRYRISYSYHINGEFYGSGIELSQNRWTTVPSDRLIGNMIQIRVNPKDFTQTFVLSRSLPGLSVEREWITADYSREME